MRIIAGPSLRVCVLIALVVLLWGCGQLTATRQPPPEAITEQPGDVSVATAEPARTAPPYPISPTEAPYPYASETVPDTEQPEGLENGLFAPPTLGVVIDKEFVVIHVDPLGSAFPAGVQQGDRLLSVGGIQLQEDMRKAKEIVFDANEGDVIEIVLVREGIEMTMEITLFPIRRESPPPPTPVSIPDDYL